MSDALEPLLPYVGEELTAVFNPKGTVYTTGCRHDFRHCTANFLIRDEEVTANSAAFIHSVASRRVRLVAGLALKIAFDFYRRKLDKPRLVVLKGEWMKTLTVQTYGDRAGVMVYADCTYAVEETPAS